MKNLLNPEKAKLTELSSGILQLGVILLVLYALSIYNYLLFHSIAEILGIIIAASIFLIAWNSRHFLENNYFLIIGISISLISSLDLLHTFTYKGVNVVTPGGNANIATQLWIASRYLTSLCFLAAPFFTKRRVNAKIALTVGITIIIGTILSIFYFKIFPVCYVDGIGLTPFKKTSEYIISGIFLLAMIFLHKKRTDFDPKVYNILSLALITTIASELMFTLYIGVTDKFNMIGHLLKILSVYLSYLAIVEYSLKKPFRTIFKHLKDSEIALEKERNKLTSILDAMEDGVFMVNRSFYIEYINPSLLKEFGPLEQKKCYEYLHGRTSPCPWCKNEEVFQGDIVRWEWHFDKNNKTYELMDTPVESADGIVSKLEMFHDISERKEIEKAKDEFLSLASHQLRTPLASISLSSELLLRGISGQVSPEQKEYLEEIHRSTKKMASLVNNLLNVSRIQMNSFEINYEPVDVNSQISQIVNELMPQIHEKKLRLTSSYSANVPQIQSDSRAIHIIVENLLTNAIRYTQSEGRLSISTEKINDHILVKVSDTGYGIPKDQQSKIFSKSFRATNAINACADGTGLGLYMVKIIADKLGYIIKFNSKENEGSTFILKIPILSK